MTYIDGCSVANTEKLAAAGCDLEEIARVIVDNYFHQVLDVGTFHADPHQGNILVSHGKPYWIDFGMIGHVTDKDIDLIQAAVKALLLQDADALVNAVMAMGAASEKTDRAKLTQDAEGFIEKYMNVKSVSDINMTAVFDEVMGLAAKNHVSMPGRFTMLARSITTMEGVLEQLCPDLNIYSMLYAKMKERARQNANIQREIFEKGKELFNAGKKAARIPVLASEVLDAMVKGKAKVIAFLDCQYLSDEQYALALKLKEQGRTLVFFHAPAYASQTALSWERVKRLTGGETYETLKMKSADELRAIYKTAGVHVYTDSDVVLSANSAWLMLHTREAGDYEIALPRRARKITEITTEKPVAENTDRFTWKLPKHSTAVFLLEH